jgi:hypothetical protein
VAGFTVPPPTATRCRPSPTIHDDQFPGQFLAVACTTPPAGHADRENLGSQSIARASGSVTAGQERRPY